VAELRTVVVVGVGALGSHAVQFLRSVKGVRIRAVRRSRSFGSSISLVLISTPAMSLSFMSSRRASVATSISGRTRWRA